MTYQLQEADIAVRVACLLRVWVINHSEPWREVTAVDYQSVLPALQWGDDERYRQAARCRIPAHEMDVAMEEPPLYALDSDPRITGALRQACTLYAQGVGDRRRETIMGAASHLVRPTNIYILTHPHLMSIATRKNPLLTAKDFRDLLRKQSKGGSKYGTTTNRACI